MEITINNWAKHNPRHDLKSMTWCRVSTTMAYDQNLFCLSPSQKWLWVFCILEAGKVNKNGTFSCTTKWLSHTSGCLEGDVVDGLKLLSEQTLITLTNESVRITNEPVRLTNENVPNITERNITEHDITLQERSDRAARVIPLTPEPKFLPLTPTEWAVGADWLEHALKQMPWKAKASGWNAMAFGEVLRKVKNTVGLNDEGMRAVFEHVSEDDFWAQNAVSPKGLLTKSKSGLKKIDTILSQMKTPEMRRNEKIIEWANSPEQDLWGEK